MKKSVYFRVPRDIVDLIGLEDNSQVALTLEEKDDRHLLIYSVVKDRALGTSLAPEPYPQLRKPLYHTSRVKSN